MSGYYPQLLADLGIQEVIYDFPLPLYTRYQMVQYYDDGAVMYHSQPRPLSEVALARLIYQINNPHKFFRCDITINF